MKNSCDLLYFDICFIVVAWNQTHNDADLGLYSLPHGCSSEICLTLPPLPPPAHHWEPRGWKNLGNIVLLPSLTWQMIFILTAYIMKIAQVIVNLKRRSILTLRSHISKYIYSTVMLFSEWTWIQLNISLESKGFSILVRVNNLTLVSCTWFSTELWHFWIIYLFPCVNWVSVVCQELF